LTLSTRLEGGECKSFGQGWSKTETESTTDSVRLKGRVCTVVILVVKELDFLNVRSVQELHVAEYVPLDEDQHTLP
jgi:hypothetical protein